MTRREALPGLTRAQEAPRSTRGRRQQDTDQVLTFPKTWHRWFARHPRPRGTMWVRYERGWQCRWRRTETGAWDLWVRATREDPRP